MREKVRNNGRAVLGDRGTCIRCAERFSRITRRHRERARLVREVAQLRQIPGLNCSEDLATPFQRVHAYYQAQRSLIRNILNLYVIAQALDLFDRIGGHRPLESRISATARNQSSI